MNTDESYADALPMTQLKLLVEVYIDSITQAFKDGSGSYKHELRYGSHRFTRAPDLANQQSLLNLDITQHSDQNYFSAAMEPVYDECKNDKGNSEYS